MTISNRAFGTSILASVFALFASVFFIGVVHAQNTANQEDTRSMMNNQKKMMADMQAAEKRLDELVAKMNASQGPEKVDQIAAVVNELVATHKRMSRMMSMPGGMMQGTQTSPQPKDGDAVDHQQHHPSEK